MTTKYEVWEAFAAETPYPSCSPSVECCPGLTPDVWVYRQRTKKGTEAVSAVRFVKQNLIFWMRYGCPDKDFIRTNYLNSPCHFVRTRRLGLRDPIPWVEGLNGELTLEAFNSLLEQAPIYQAYFGSIYSFWIAQCGNKSDLYERMSELALLVRFLGWDKNPKLIHSINQAIKFGAYKYLDHS